MSGSTQTGAGGTTAALDDCDQPVAGRSGPVESQGPPEVPIERLSVCAYCVPAEAPEAGGAPGWSGTSVVVVEVAAGGKVGLGYTYAATAAARLAAGRLAGVVRGRDALAVARCWAAMRHVARNMGKPGVLSAAIAAVDVALWDLKARLLELPLVRLLGPVRAGVPVYASGFDVASAGGERLRRRLAAVAATGIRRVKIKIGSAPGADLERVRVARDAAGDAVELFVDADGAFSRQQALALAEEAARLGVTWFEEPVSADDLEGLRLVRDRSPAGIDVAAGERGHDLFYFRRMLEAGAVDVLQADATRCGGITELLRVAALCEAWPLPLSAHAAPALHVHPCCALAAVRHAEWFHEHQRVEGLLFDGAPVPRDGMLYPDLGRPGLGLELKRRDAERFAVRF